MSKPTHKPNTQTTEDRALWQQIRQAIAQRTRKKRLKYGLRSNREAHLHCPHPTGHERPTLAPKSSLFPRPDRSPQGVRGEQLPAQRTKHQPIHPRRPHRAVEVLVLIPQAGNGHFLAAISRALPVYRSLD